MSAPGKYVVNNGFLAVIISPLVVSTLSVAVIVVSKPAKCAN